MRYLTKKKALQYFKESWLPNITRKHEQNGEIDVPARREGWNNFIDSLAKEGLISQKQCDTWHNPF